MGGGGTQAAPVPTQAEQDAQQAQADNLSQQTAILKAQYQQQQLLAPILYKQAGLTPTMDAQGNITGFTQDPTQQANQALTDSIQTQTLQRESDALAGKLPIDPGLTQELNQEDQTLNSTLQKNLGTGYATSTPGIQAQATQANKRAALTYAVQTGDITNSAALQQSVSQSQNDSLNRLLGVSGATGQTASLYGQNAQGYGSLIGSYQNQSNLAANVAGSNVASRNAASQNTTAAVGAGVGIAAAAAIAI